MEYNGIDLIDYMRIIDIRGRGLTEQELTTIRASGSSEDYVSYRTMPARYIEVDFQIKAENKEELRKKIDVVSGFIATNESVPIVFSDESDRVYYGEYAGVQENLEYHHIGIHRGTIFILRDKYKYGPERTPTIASDDFMLSNEGTAEADPIFELTATEKTTFVMVSNGEQYNLIGAPADDDTEVVDAKQKIYELTGMDGWSYDGIKSDSRWPKVTGTMQHDGSGIRPLNFGTGEKIHGPGVIQELSETAQDFEVDVIFDIISERVIDNFRLQVDMFDEGMNYIGTVGIKDNNRFNNERTGLGRVGPYRGGGVQNGYIIGEDTYTHELGDNTSMHMSFKREGNTFDLMIGRWRVNRLQNILKGTYRDVNNEYAGRLKYIQVLIGSFGDRAKPARLRINKIDVFKLTQATVDQTPYILYPGDIITFDHKDDDILINGEPRNDLKNFGGSFFTLKKGQNTLVVTPEDSFDVGVKYRDKYL